MEAPAAPATMLLPEAITPEFIKAAKHPTICLFHLLFKLLALLVFIFGSWVFGGRDGDFVFTFVVTTVLLALDFWTVKNVTGRILVGMRWFSDVKEDGSSDWVFQAAGGTFQQDPADKKLFWVGLYLWPAVWGVLFLIYIFRLNLEAVLLVVMGIVMSGANLVGFWKCSKAADPSKSMLQEWASAQAVRAVFGRVVTAATNAASGAAAATRGGGGGEAGAPGSSGTSGGIPGGMV
eukprot:GHVU01233397.1.p1 GENE.GHVU01233397.1~~GHVU01233397.1.p1  ORF type:complete len:235 (-),score=49.57 GHVU01233397.1:451-1155(-)